MASHPAVLTPSAQALQNSGVFSCLLRRDVTKDTSQPRRGEAWGGWRSLQALAAPTLTDAVGSPGSCRHRSASGRVLLLQAAGRELGLHHPPGETDRPPVACLGREPGAGGGSQKPHDATVRRPGTGVSGLAHGLPGARLRWHMGMPTGLLISVAGFAEQLVCPLGVAAWPTAWNMAARPGCWAPPS